MPAYRLTADSIWTSFRSSGKRHLLLTGGRGSGKTTLFSKLVPTGCPGITTWAVPQEGVYLRDNLRGETAQIGRFDPMLPGPENRMQLCEEALAMLGIPALTRCAQVEGDWVSIDEIGYLECSSPAYCSAILQLMERKRLLAVVRKQELPFLQALCGREDVFLLDLDRPFGRLGCVIMASGLGKRFGGNKLLADFGGMPMLCRSLAATDGIFSHRIVVTRHVEVERLCREMGIFVLRHDLPHRSDTVRLGLASIADAIDGCLFSPGDQPLLRWETVASLALSAVDDGDAIWRTAYQDAAGSPVLFPKRLFPELLALPEGRGGGVLIQNHPEQVRTVQVRDAYELEDADTPEALQRLQQLWETAEKR